MSRFALPIILFIQTFYCWWCFFEAKHLPYDENYGTLIQAILVSFAMWVALRMIRSWKKKWLNFPRVIFWSWLFTGSPAIFVITFIFYARIFGTLAV